MYMYLVTHVPVHTAVLLTHPDRNTQNERKATQSNAKQRTQGKQNQRYVEYHLSRYTYEHRSECTVIASVSTGTGTRSRGTAAVPISN